MSIPDVGGQPLGGCPQAYALEDDSSIRNPMTHQDVATRTLAQAIKPKDQYGRCQVRR
jgi:hypothetical protein